MSFISHIARLVRPFPGRIVSRRRPPAGPRSPDRPAVGAAIGNARDALATPWPLARVAMLAITLALGTLAGCTTETPPQPADSAGSADGETKPKQPAPPVSVAGETEPGTATSAAANGEAPERPGAAGASGEQSQKESTTEPGTGAEPGDGAGGGLSALIDPDRKGIAGRWLLTMTTSAGGERFVDLRLALLEIKPREDAEGQYTVTVRDTLRFLQGARLVSGEATEREVHVRLEDTEGDAWDFRGTFADGVVRGSLLIGGGGVNAARLLPVTRDSIEDVAEFEEAEGAKDFVFALRAKDRATALAKFAEAHPLNPLALPAMQGLLYVEATSGNLTKERVLELAADYAKAAEPWGDRMRRAAWLNSLMMAENLRLDLPIVRALLARAEKEVDDELKQTYGRVLEIIKQNVDLREAIEWLQADDPQRREQALQRLAAIRKQRPFDASVIYALAMDAERHGQPEKAIELYGMLAVLPSLERELVGTWLKELDEDALPAAKVTQLWKQTHNGTTDGLQQYLDELYRKTLTSFLPASDRSPQPQAAQRIVLVELFTGAACPPCVAADVAVSGLESMYPPSMLVALRYHQHIPAPDPLANADTETRFAYYQALGTPTIVVNGRQLNPPQNFAGPLSRSPDVFENLRAVVEEALQQKATVTIRPQLEQDKPDVYRIHAEATGTDAGLPETARLRIALAEDLVRFVAQNGIREHELVVRKLLPNANGFAPENGRIVADVSVDIEQLRKELIDYLTRFEEQSGGTFKFKPLELRRFHVVLFVQDDATKEVLQAAAVSLPQRVLTPASTPQPGDAGKTLSESSDEAKPKPASQPAEKKPSDPAAKSEAKPTAKTGSPAPAAADR